MERCNGGNDAHGHSDGLIFAFFSKQFYPLLCTEILTILLKEDRESTVWKATAKVLEWVRKTLHAMEGDLWHDFKVKLL